MSTPLFVVRTFESRLAQGPIYLWTPFTLEFHGPSDLIVAQVSRRKPVSQSEPPIRNLSFDDLCVRCIRGANLLLLGVLNHARTFGSEPNRRRMLGNSASTKAPAFSLLCVGRLLHPTLPRLSYFTNFLSRDLYSLGLGVPAFCLQSADTSPLRFLSCPAR